MRKSTLYLVVFVTLFGIVEGCGDDGAEEQSATNDFATTTEQATEDNTDAETDTMVSSDTGMATEIDTQGDTGSGQGSHSDHGTATDTGVDSATETQEGECGLFMDISQCDACIAAQCAPECVACQANPECEAIFECMVHDCIEQGRASDMECHYQCAGEHLEGYMEFEAFWRAAAEGCIALKCTAQCPNHEH